MTKAEIEVAKRIRENINSGNPEDGCFYHKGQKPKSMEYIRGMYGSQRFTSKEETGISVA